MIIVNGLPKSGTHAVMAWLTTLGLVRRPGTILGASEGIRVVGGDLESVRQDRRPGHFILAHVPAIRELWGSIITVFRDPRNVLLSYCRHRQREDAITVSIADAIADYWGTPFVPLYTDYLGWHGRSVVLRYEDLPSSQVGTGQTIYRDHNQDWNTCTGQPSDWRSVWTEEAEKAWQNAGGPELVREAGYGDHDAQLIELFKEEAA